MVKRGICIGCGRSIALKKNGEIRCHTTLVKDGYLPWSKHCDGCGKAPTTEGPMNNTTTPWMRSSFCAEANCVEVRRVGDVIEVRDSKLGDESPVLPFTVEDWADVLSDFSLGSGGLEWFYFAQLSFTDAEKAAFVTGVRRGEFDLERLADEWRTAETPSAPSATSDPDPRTETTPEARELGAESGPVPGNVHPAVRITTDRIANLLDELLVIGHRHAQGIEKLPDADRRALLTAAVHFAIDMTRTRWADKLTALADEIEAAAADTTKERDYDAFYDAADDELAAMVSVAVSDGR